MQIDRITLGQLIADRLEPLQEDLRAQWAQTSGRYFVVDDLLDPSIARDIHGRFPQPSAMMVKRSLREHKCVAAQMDRFDPLLEEIVFGFQTERVRSVISGIVDMQELLPDERLYAGGISLMAKGHFLNPHLDNSHNNDRSAYRVLNLLYYVSPNWTSQDGGSLEIWPDGPNGKPIELESKFNRLVVMATDQRSWHSVSKVRADASRCCVSNYFFSRRPPTGTPYFHVTSFTGRPDEPVRSAVLLADRLLRMSLRKVFPKGVRPTDHIYKK